MKVVFSCEPFWLCRFALEVWLSVTYPVDPTSDSTDLACLVPASTAAGSAAWALTDCMEVQCDSIHLVPLWASHHEQLCAGGLHMCHQEMARELIA